MALPPYTKEKDEGQPTVAEAMKPPSKRESPGTRRTQADRHTDEYSGKRSFVMAQLQIAYPLRAGTQERWRRLWQDIAELRREQFAAICQQAGISRVQVRLLQLLHGELLLVSVQMQEPQQSGEVLASAASPFAHWLGEQVQSLLGWNVREALADAPADLLFTWES
jgi:hypothetical protein